VSPDGRWVAFVADAALRPDSIVDMERDSLARLPYLRSRDDVDRNESDIFVIPVTGGTPRKVTSFFGGEGSLAWSPDSRRLAFIGSPGRMKSDRVYVVNVASGSAENVIGDWRYEPQSIQWLADGSIAMSGATGGSTGVFRIDPTAKRMTQVLSGRRRITGTSTDSRGARVAFVATRSATPSGS
jgi:Tol biopolymer transport system component